MFLKGKYFQQEKRHKEKELKYELLNKYFKDHQ